jgi:flavin-binding protein dodecin
MTRRALKKAAGLEPGENRPTAERLRHGPVERFDRAIADAHNNASRPYRALDTLAIMERRGSITAGMRQAGEDFRTRFATAQLDPLRALDISQVRLGDRSSRHPDEGSGLRIEAARDAVWRAIQSVGGIASPAGSCIWHVVGWECSLKAWAVEQGWNGRRVSQETASGILVAALGALEAYFSNRIIMRK